jgi:hypothetical protein
MIAIALPDFVNVIPAPRRKVIGYISGLMRERAGVEHE